DQAKPHSQELSTKSSTDITNSPTWPKRCVSQPVSGTVMALATANEVITQVPWVALTPRSPAMVGIETLAIEESSTFMNTAADRAMVPNVRALPSRGGYSRGGGVAAGAAATRPCGADGREGSLMIPGFRG